MKTIRIAKQWGLEKMGRAEVVSESNTVRFLSEKNEESKAFLKDTYKRIERQCKANDESIEEGKGAVAAFNIFGQRMQQAYSQHELASMMNQLGQFQTMVETLKESLNRSLLSDVGTQFEVLVKSDLTESTNGKAKYDKYRRQYDAAMTRYRNAENKLKPGKTLTEEDKEVAEAKKELEKATEEVTGLLEFVNKKTEMFLFEKFCQTFVAYEEFFTRGHAFINEMKPHFARYRQQAEKAKKEYEDIKSRGRAYVPPTPVVSIDESKRVFGVPLADLLARNNGALPRVIQNAILFILRPEIITLEGIFRISGNVAQVQDLQQQIDTGREMDFAKIDDPHCVAGIVKLWLRLLPESIFPLPNLSTYIALGKPETVPEEQQLQVLKSAVESLPEINKQVLHVLLYLCSEIDKRQEENLMKASNLSTVVGPNLFFRETSDPREMMEAMQPSNTALTLLIKNYDSIFSQPPSFVSERISAATTDKDTLSGAQDREDRKVAQEKIDDSFSAVDRTSSLSTSNSIVSIVANIEALPTHSAEEPQTEEASSSQKVVPPPRSDDLLLAERDGPAAVTGTLVSVVASFVNVVAPMIDADVASEGQIQNLNSNMKLIAATLKEAFDAMPAFAVTYPNTKSSMATAARHLRPAAKNVLAAAKAVNEAPGDRAARISLLAAARELLGATHSLVIAASDGATLPCAVAQVETLLQQCAQHTTRILQITAGAVKDDIHAVAFAALTSAEQLRFNATMAAASVVNSSAAQQLLKSVGDVELHLSKLSSIAVPLLGGAVSSDLSNDPQLKEAARMVATEFRNVARALREAASASASAPLAHEAEVSLLQTAHEQLLAFTEQLQAESPSLSPDHAELLNRSRSLLDHLSSFITVTTEGASPSWDANQLAAAQWLGADAALMVAGRSESGTEGTLAACRAVHLLRQLAVLAVAGAGARRLSDHAAMAPLSSLPVPELLHPALVVGGLVAGVASFLRQYFFSSITPS